MMVMSRGSWRPVVLALLSAFKGNETKSVADLVALEQLYSLTVVDIASKCDFLP